ncbi:MAG: hypothetical protein A2015_09900 [Spirochaetes bacterium GWF1_31_7]|nr:MAG: hypothetical protein A2Y30_07285 [Spirochaetes bacterium GWE1_32_154]OHD45664.1 MAG: hypothetical protein A2Y29_15805 [Spirochaetes bacterium GWE2_31_10]OHD48235.1 MAG: hypothetical protein A2015_09900 [Spirochaetes bacterium GWF1_31_7]HBD95774.1 hypothetical protein [Spirochaetia bacterium]HBI37579.1 hypothetical protein [Spirochaetia bacterium]
MRNLYIVMFLFNSFLIYSITVTPVSTISLYSTFNNGLSPISGNSKIISITPGTPLLLIEETPSESDLFGDMLFVEVMQGTYKGRKGWIFEEFIYPIADANIPVYFYVNNDIKTQNRTISKNSILLYESNSIINGTFALLLKETTSNMTIIIGDLSQLRYFINIEHENRYRLYVNDTIIRVLDALTLLPVNHAGEEKYISDTMGYIYWDNPLKNTITIHHDKYHNRTVNLNNSFTTVYLLPKNKETIRFKTPSTLLLALPCPDNKLISEAIILNDDILPEDFIQSGDIYQYSFDFELQTMFPSGTMNSTGKTSGIFIIVKPDYNDENRNVVISNTNKEISNVFLMRNDGLSYRMTENRIEIAPGVYEVFFESCAGDVIGHRTIKSYYTDTTITFNQTPNSTYQFFQTGETYKLTNFKKQNTLLPAQWNKDEMIATFSDYVISLSYANKTYYGVIHHGVQSNTLALLAISDFSISPTLFLPQITLEVQIDRMTDILFVDITDINIQYRTKMKFQKLPDTISELKKELPLRLYFEKQ